MPENQEPQSPQKNKKKTWKPPFDAFGLNPSFYLQGKDKTVSWIGFICSVMLILCILAVVIAESISYLNYKKSEIYVNMESSSEVPVIDLSQKKYILVLRSVYPESGATFSGVPQSNFIQINYYKVKMSLEVELNGGIFAPDRTLVPQIPCEDLKFDLTDVNYSPEDLKGAKCLELTSETKIGGSYEANLLYIQQIEIVPCKIEGTQTCEVMMKDPNTGLDVLTNTRDTTQAVNEYLRDFVLEISYIQETVDVGSFEKPIMRNLNSDTRLRFNGGVQTFITFEFNQLEVQTSSGSYKKETESVSGLYIKSSTFNQNTRVPTDEVETLLDGQVTPLERTPYVFIQF